MDWGFSLKLENPRKSANIFSKTFFGWMIKFCYKGTKKGLEIFDLYKTLNGDESNKLTDKLELNWNEQVLKAKCKNTTPSLLRAIIKTFIRRYMFYGALLFIQVIALRSFQPLVLGYFITLFSHSDDPEHMIPVYILAAVICLQSFFTVLFAHHIDFGQSAIGMRIRIAVSSLVYRKILRLSKRSLGQVAAGHVVNLLSNDVNRFDLITVALHYLWITPFQVLLVSWLIWREVGIASLVGVLSMILLNLPVQGYLSKLTSRLRLKIAERTDYRVKLMNEVIAGIQVIKMYAWEKPFEVLVKKARKSEINALTQASYLRGIYLSCMVFTERTTLFLTIVCYVLMGNIITADRVFSMAQFYSLLQLAMAILISLAIAVGGETLISIKRLEEFLVLEEKSQSMVEHTSLEGVVIKNVDASWTPDSRILKNVSLTVPRGSLCAIVGPVGGGKTSLLQLLLGELAPTSGLVQVQGKVSYASQEPWLFASNVRNNILFGQEYDRQLYRNVVKVCALEKDFQQFSQGDRTMVGERGVALSGGQRARINLARAVYRDADVYLMDDPLSAVDTHVGKHLFQECILGYLKGKTRVLVTHQLQYLKKADLIVVVNKGCIEAMGSFQELSDSHLDFSKLLVAANETDDKEHERHQESSLDRRQSVLSRNSIKSELSEESDSKIHDEEISLSNTNPLRDYVKASGHCCTIIGLFAIIIVGQAFCSAADYWVTLWTQQEALRHSNDPQVKLELIPNNSSHNKSGYYYYESYNDFIDEIIIDNEVHHLIKTDVAMYVYTGFIIGAIITTLLRSFAFFKMAMIASKNLHNKMFHALLKAPMRFFDLNPSGRVLNRFSKDMGAIDELLPRVLMDAILILLVMSGILIMIIIANYYIVIAMILLGAFFLKVRSWYVMTAKDVKHLEGITKSPVFSHLNSSLNGITTIRASQAEAILIKQFDNHQDAHTSAWYLTIACRVCFGLWLDLICVFFVTLVVFSFVVLNYFQEVSGSFVGLAISQSLILTGMLQYGMRQTAEVINQLTSVERIMQYTKLDNEEDRDKVATLKKMHLRPDWPNAGCIIFQDLSLRYSDNEPAVLKNLNVVIVSGAKIGIVGRTGAGKSSLISALFRLAPIDGAILIDGVDTKTISLYELRKKISIIPQEPVLFSATLRYNLDPFNEFEDKQLWNVLCEVELKDVVSSLESMVSEGGSNFSLGQRQLLCLARAILRNNKILILDEATANVDQRTDALIQATLRRKFNDCTVLTIAHRLNTVMDSDKILVMNFGKIVEYDHPHLLLQNPDGYLSKMVAETGPTMEQQLRQISLDAYQLRASESIQI